MCITDRLVVLTCSRTVARSEKPFEFYYDIAVAENPYLVNNALHGVHYSMRSKQAFNFHILVYSVLFLCDNNDGCVFIKKLITDL